ncbi:putative aminopeptidase [Helianthus annuus]|nr:putative aminopeptidase [Helianthus annuus]KAJ0496377.1 putative aminopeptidase [Helianthus annuus]KAJ0662436.1 putative aminopeptidase [Helianthus annuus]KAJ0669966.1 putative aminopeptidase [Helianthus annuus]
MKFDMGGLVADLGDAKAIGQIKPLGVEVKKFLHFDYINASGCYFGLLRNRLYMWLKGFR